jgi:small subunit ribosomal protein S20
MMLAVPNIKAAEKWTLQSVKRQARNKGVKSRLKTLFKGAATAREAAGVPAVESAYDKAAAKGVIHPNKAARKKARLAKAVQRAATTTAKPAKTKASRKK